MAAIGFTIDVKPVQTASDRLNKVGSSVIGPAAVAAINKVLPPTYDTAVKKMLSGINMTRTDVDAEMRIEPASDPLKPEGFIVAGRKTRRPSTMRRFRVGMILQQNRWSNVIVAQKIAANARNVIPPGTAPLPWKLRKGDSLRGVPAGQKFAGLRVEVKKGSVKEAGHWFFLKGKNGVLLPARVKRNAEKKWGRKGKGNIEVIHGPSVWQLFRAQIPGLRDETIATFQKTLDAEIKDLFLKALK